MWIGVSHIETISFWVLEGATTDIILGRPWLQHHQPNINWTKGEVLRWGKRCLKDYIKNQKQGRNRSEDIPVGSIITEKLESSLAPSIPDEYQTFQDVFSHQFTAQLPPHRPGDCAIELLPRAVMPKGRIYPLPIPEQKAMDDYISEAFDQQYICPSISPAASSFFFVGKKDGGLRPCIDYRTLNLHTKKFV